jgi:hypothetical protein
MKNFNFFYVFLIALMVFLVVNFSLTSYFVYSPKEYDIVVVNRFLPESYEKGVPFEVFLEIDFNESVLVDGNLFLGEVVEGGEVVFSSFENALFSEGVLFIGGLELRDFNFSYQVVSNFDSVNFSGRWGLNFSEKVYCSNCEGGILGDVFLSYSNEKFLNDDEKKEVSSSGGGGAGGGGFGGVPLSSEEAEKNEINFFDNSLNSSVSFGEKAFDSKIDVKDPNSFWWIILSFISFLILVLIFVIYLKIKKSRENSFS